jgi:ABC-type transport system substrate-binding protein
LLKKKGEGRIIMKKILFAMMAILTTLMFVSIMPVNAPPPKHCKGLDIYFYENPDAAFAALTACEVDFIQWSLTVPQYESACSNPDLQLASYAENGMMEFDINNNYTIPTYPGVRSPTNDLSFRQAIACCVDRDWITNEVCGGFAEAIYCPICAPQKGFGNESCCFEETYPYPFDMDAAAAYLAADGWEDLEPDGTLNYPEGWDGAPGRPNMDPIVVYCRSDHDHRLVAGRALCDNMRALGIAVDQREETSDITSVVVMDDRNYNIYTGGWSLGRRPTYLYGLFHESQWFEGGSNYITGMNASNLPNYPDLDEVLMHVRYPVTIEEFQDAVKEASGKITCDYCINLPLWSYVSWWAYKKTLVGIVNMDGYGLENTYTFLSAKKCDDPATPGDESQDPIRMGTIHAPKDLNVLYATWYYDYAVLDRVFSYLLSVNPYNLAIDQPWIAQDWEVTTWYDPHDDEEKSKVTYWIRKDVWWHAPETGEVVYQMDANDVEFSIWYIANYPDCWVWPGVQDVHHTIVTDQFCIEVYFDSISLWHQYNPTGPILPKQIYEPLLCEQRVLEVHVDDPLIPSDYWQWTSDWVTQIDSVFKDGTIELVEGVDYELIWDPVPTGCHNVIHLLRPLDVCQDITFTYWTPVADPHGYYLAGLPWEDTWYSIGPYYPIEIVPGVGGRAILNCNPTHFLGGPPDGEIDWMWYWSGTTKPRSGYYQVNLYDAVYLLSAYCSRGDTCETPANWFPGADIDCYDLCHVGLYDAVLLLSHYGEKFGIPPDP